MKNDMHKLRESFHKFSNRINSMNSVIALPALAYLNKDLKSFNDDEKKELLKSLDEMFLRRSDIYREAINAEEDIITQLMHCDAQEVLEHFDKIMHIAHDMMGNNTDLLKKIHDCRLNGDFEGYIKGVLKEALKFDKETITITELLEKTKLILRNKGLYPKDEE